MFKRYQEQVKDLEEMAGVYEGSRGGSSQCGKFPSGKYIGLKERKYGNL